MKPTMGNREWGVLCLVALLYASSFYFHKIAIAHIPPTTLAAGRMVLAFPVSWVLLKVRGGRLPAWGAEWKPLAVMGLFAVSVPFVATAWGQQRIEAGLAGILMATVPVLTVLLAPLFLKEESYSRLRLLGVAVGLGGVVLVIGPTALAGLSEYVLGELVTLIAPLCYASVTIYVRRHREISSTLLAAGQYAWGILFLVPLSLLIDAPWRLNPPVEALAALVAIALLSTVLANVLNYWLIGQVGATNTSLISFFVPIFAVLMGAGLLGELLPWEALTGLVVILGAAYLVGGRRRANSEHS